MTVLRAIALLLPTMIGLLLADNSVAGPGFPSVHDSGKSLTFHWGQQEIATYFYQHDKIQRPFFANIHTPDGVKVTRNFPPAPGIDATDHDTMHPGISIAFGDLSGEDFWRNQARVVHAGFTSPPKVGPGRISFTELKKYLATDGSVLCQERFECVLHFLPEGMLIQWDSTFSSEQEFYFGDQEEMGLAIRVATPITEIKGGQITDSAGRVGAQNVWSQSSAWCDYSGRIDSQVIGVTILCHRDNFRESWMHARDYGFVAANAFGRAAMKKGPTDKTYVKPGQPLRMRYGIFVHGDQPDLDAIHKRYLAISGSD